MSKLHIYQKGPKGLWNTHAADGTGDLSSKDAFTVTMTSVDIRVRSGSVYQIRKGSAATGDLYACEAGASAKGDVARFRKINQTYAATIKGKTMPADKPFALPEKAMTKLSLAASDGAFQIGQLGASGMSLVPTSASLTMDQANAAYFMQLYGQGTALGELQEEGYDITDPSIFQSYAYYSKYIDNLSELGLAVKSASEEKVVQKSYSGSIKVGDILLDILSAYIPAAELADMTKLFDLLAKTSDTKITDFLNFFWDNASYSSHQSSLAFGPLTMGSEMMPEFTVVYYNIDYSMDHWRSLFIEIEHSKLEVYSSAVKLSYNMELYNDTVQGAIMPIIKDSIKTHVRTMPFALK